MFKGYLHYSVPMVQNYRISERNIYISQYSFMKTKIDRIHTRYVRYLSGYRIIIMNIFNVINQHIHVQ